MLEECLAEAKETQLQTGSRDRDEVGKSRGRGKSNSMAKTVRCPEGQASSGAS